ncbi:MAG: RIP metalloprotease RseP [Finegoldia magna]|uniref:Zinc metalloprotease n=2 Tax=Finegoldia magna TaxID=1260 RepID=A0A233W1E7_FINMA|nr:RIP metalloprotease RseP [Finegoldia magna]EFK93532.1 RIP metalloprotease RseP [Finegoldia magna ACS-171-V-Col3]EFL54982.1 RIP metalloprotease RseP [Finegoldia magna BVS033A4]EGS33816.1 RIP metalloprotease RseP-like protein [Finegoldia magna SY403409CC001050417]EXF26930.1 peptidase [Finegoldia magna ALB8]MBS6928185.1 RIP metalloprotease RseP [Finegoldia magna]
MITIISSIIIFLLVILIHEFGHFIVAKMNGVSVLEFSIGMGPKLFQKESNGTLYSLRLLPVGGYCQLEGEDEENDSPNSLNNQSPFVRLKVILAGAIMNFILAFILLILLMSVSRVSTEVSGVLENSPAYSSGIQAGDKIVSINGQMLEDGEQVLESIKKSKGDLDIVLLRNEKSKNIKVTPRLENNNRKIGVNFQEEYNIKNFNIIKGLEKGIATFLNLTGMLYKFLGMLITGKLGLGGVSGPVGVVKEIGNAAKTGVANLIFLLAYININLGVFNLLPIPALDGGRAIFILIEMIFGKKISQEKEGYIHMVGLILLLGLIAIVTIKDVIKLF